ncbi:shikimate kinase [Microbacterium hominis]|uniref:Shikimate kinase n=1 Tax=Microbacterium hominis TaxID=162426 RepID=A0A7D4U7T7_9MICO|nr:shikimate kinase [Microbacterium hominis]QKJ19486.1 shikimate kinase [Microbacterium hominis]
MTSRADAIVLIGPMGAGKTSIGKRVAKALGVAFYDSDVAVVRAHGPIEALFATHGEGHFRALEREAVRAGLDAGGVVSLGGGAVLDPATRAALDAHRVVLLTVEPQVVAGRVRDSARPLLAGADAMARWSEIYAERLPLYEQLADVVFDTSHGPLQNVVDDIVAWARSTEEEER